MTPVPGIAPRAAIVRPPGRSFARALSGHPARATIDPARAQEQHAAYVAALADLVAELQLMTPPATLDGGDVLRLGQTLVVGGSQRTNRAGVEQLARFARSCGLDLVVAAVPDDVLHLQTAVTAVAGDAAVGAAFMLAQPVFRSVRRRVVVPPEEAPGCNVLAVGTTAVLPARCPVTAAAIRRLGLEVREVDLDEVYKADGGATCLSLLV